MINKVFLRGKGEGKTHRDMTSFIRELMEEMGYIDVTERHPVKHRNPDSDNEFIASEHGWYHETDVHGAQILHYPNGDVFYFHTYVEIDGESHDNKKQKNKDKTSEQMIHEYHNAYPKLGGHRIIRIKKSVVLKSMKSGNTGLLKQKISLVMPTWDDVKKHE